jgi:predicted PurR-regulated permease PerM
MLTRYFGGILIQMTIITAFVSVLLGLFGIQNALLIGFFAALINVIPYVGPLIGATFGLIITISSNLDLEFYTQMLPMLVKVVAVFGAMQLLDNFMLQPWIFSNSVLAHPLEIFIVILMGAQLNGIGGMVLAIPVYTVLRVIAGVFLSKFKIVQKMTVRMRRRNS